MGRRVLLSLVAGCAFVCGNVWLTRQVTNVPLFWPLLPGMLAAFLSPDFGGIKEDRSGLIAYVLMYSVNIAFYSGITWLILWFSARRRKQALLRERTHGHGLAKSG